MKHHVQKPLLLLILLWKPVLSFPPLAENEGKKTHFPMCSTFPLLNALIAKIRWTPRRRRFPSLAWMCLLTQTLFKSDTTWVKLWLSESENEEKLKKKKAFMQAVVAVVTANKFSDAPTCSLIGWRDFSGFLGLASVRSLPWAAPASEGITS